MNCRNCHGPISSGTFCSAGCHMEFERKAYQRSKEKKFNDPVPELKPAPPPKPKPIKGKRRQAVGKERACAQCGVVLDGLEYKYCSNKCRSIVAAKVQEESKSEQ